MIYTYIHAFKQNTYLNMHKYHNKKLHNLHSFQGRNMSELSDSDIGKSGSSTPKKKRAMRHELARDEKKSRKQLFSRKWMEEDIFKRWLLPTEDPAKAKCKVCQLNLGTKRSDLLSHGKSQKHLKNMNLTQITRPITEIFQSSKQDKNLIIADIRFTLLAASHNFSFSSIDHVTDTCKLSFSDSKIAKNMQLRRTKCTSILKNVLASTIKEALCGELKNNSFSILVDESTDISNYRYLCILVRYIYENKIKTELLDLIPIKADEGSAKGLYSLFKKCLTDFNLSVNNIVGYCSDNASVMMGNKESFKTYLLNENHHIVVNGCVCHSAHLIAAAASQELPSNIEALLQNISNYFSRSPKRQSVLEEFQQFMRAAQLKIISPSKTRWLALSNCVERLIDQWDVLLEVFRVAAFEDKNQVGNMIFNEMQNPYVKAYLLFLKHVLPIFNSFNAMFQSSKVLVDKMYVESRRFVKILCVNFVKPSCYTSEVELDLLNVFDPNVLLPVEEINVGLNTMNLLKDCIKADNEQFKLKCLKFYQVAVAQAFKRLPTKDKFYKNITFVQPQNALNVNLKHDIDEICNTFKNKIDPVKAITEYNNIKIYFSEEEKESLTCDDVITFWTTLLDMKNFNDEHLFRNISIVALIILTLTHGNADVERVFSIMTDVKSKKRNRLSPDTLSDILRVKIDLATKNKCCTSYAISESHFQKFNQFMYQFKTKNEATRSTAPKENVCDTDTSDSD